MNYIILSIALALVVVLFLIIKFKKKSYAIGLDLELHNYILEYIPFVQSLPKLDQDIFFKKTQDFMNTHNFIGVETEITSKDKALVAASIVMMIFKSNIDLTTKIDNIYLSDKPITGSNHGLPGKATGFVRQSNSGTDIYLSRLHLIHGYTNLDDNKNVGVHEFAHFIDGLDGKIDGFPMALLPKGDVTEWNLLAQKYMGLIEAGDTLIDRYATKNRSEFFAVSSEFFFENPFLMEKKYPELYHFLAKIYGTNLASAYRTQFGAEPKPSSESNQD